MAWHLRFPDVAGIRGPLRICAATAGLLSLGGCNQGVLNPQGPIGSAEKTILFNSLAIMLAIIIPTSIATLLFAWWFRDSNPRARYRPDFVYSGGIELVVWGIPTLVIIFLGGIIWIGSYQLDPAQPIPAARKPVNVQVVSLDWKWLFLYPDQGVATVNQVIVPAATPLHFSLTSGSVMNAFFIPQLGSMIYTMYGMRTQLYLQADRKGVYYGRSTMFSGDGFPGMEFNLRAVSDDEFADWVRTTKSSGPMLDRESYASLAKQSTDLAPSTYSALDPGLFDAITTGALAPAPGPDSGRPAPDVKPTHGG